MHQNFLINNNAILNKCMEMIKYVFNTDNNIITDTIIIKEAVNIYGKIQIKNKIE